MRGGQLTAVASVQVLLEQSTAHRKLWIAGDAGSGQWERVLATDPRVLDVRVLPHGVEILYAGTLEQQADLMHSVLDAGIRIYQFAERPTDIEELFLRLTDRAVEQV